MRTVIFGKGPSFRDLEADFKICINEAALSITRPDVAVAVDPKVFDVLKVCVNKDVEFWHPQNVHVKWPKTLAFKDGEESLASAIRVCKLKGIMNVLFCGCDAMLNVESYPKYKEVVAQSWRALRDTRIRYSFA